MDFTAVTLAAPDSVLADPGQVGAGNTLVFGPIIVALALVTWLGLTLRAAVLTQRRRLPAPSDQSPHRGPMEGGVYRYSPGMYSHSYAPGETDYYDEHEEARSAETGYADLSPEAAERDAARRGTHVGILEREAKRGRRHRWSRRRG